MAKSVIPIGPWHPLQEEPELFTLTVDGETVVDIEVSVGYNHRGIEKLSEMKSFDQAVFVIERICGICSTSHPFAYTRAVEDVIPVEVPERAKYIRTIVAETERQAIFQQNQSIPDNSNKTPCIMYHNQQFLQRESEKKKRDEKIQDTRN